MKRPSIPVAVAAAFAAMLSVPAAFGQTAEALKVNVPFAFMVENKNCPPGVYFFSRAQGQDRVLMTNAEGKLSLWLPIVTALARSSNDDDHLLAFDKVDEKRVLSEVWLPDRDGSLVHITKGDHAHEIVRLKAAADRAPTREERSRVQTGEPR